MAWKERTDGFGRGAPGEYGKVSGDVLDRRGGDGGVAPGLIAAASGSSEEEE